jgi:site-specific DNA recombinase
VRVAIYSRVSTSLQVEHQTIEQQLERLAAAAHAHAADGWVLDPAHVFRDDGYSGAVLARPGLDRLRDAVRGREVDRVLVTAPDRLARNYVHQMVLLEEWAQAGCTTEFLDRPMSDDPHDHLLLQIRGAVAEYERTLITERMRRGRLAKLRAGTLLPWIGAPYGYRANPDRPRDPRGITIDPAEAAVVTELFALYREPGTSLLRLAMHLNARGVPTPSGMPCWSCPTIRGILCNPTYTGQVYAHRTQSRAPTRRHSATHAIGRPRGTAVPLPVERWLLVGEVPALVSQAHFDEVQAKLATNRSFASRNNTAHQYLLRALVSCGCCGLACTGRTVNQRTSYYRCNGKRHSVQTHRTTRCPSRFIPVRQLDELVWQDLCTLLSEPASLAAAVTRAQGGAWLPQELQARRESLRRGQAHLRHQLERLTDAYLGAIIPLDEYGRRRRDLEQRLQALAEQEEQLRNDAACRQRLAGVAASLEAFRARVQRGLADASFEQRRQLVLLLIDRVIVTDAEVEIRYVLPTSPESEHVRFCHLRKDYSPDLQSLETPLCGWETAER